MSLSVTGRILRTALSRRSCPASITLPHGVHIIHDAQGIPTISAPNALACAFGQGYISALHRLWTMEQQRRVAAARMSEIAGQATLEIDRWICWLGIKEAVEASYNYLKADTETMEILEAYSAGVNHFISQTGDWGFEFDLLGVHPEPWTPKDSVAVLTLVAWSLAGNWEEQLVRVNTLAALGPEQAAHLETDAWLPQQAYAHQHRQFATAIPQAFELFARLTDLLPTYQNAKQQGGLLPRRSGSNAWVVSGSYTMSGKPVLAGDPHMPLGLPGFFYEVQMMTPTTSAPDTLAVAGAALAGIPGVISGRNQQFAWSITIVGAITAELRLTRATGEPKRQIKHTIAVKGQRQPETLEVRWSECGPILSHVQLPEGMQYGVSLEWTGHKGEDVSTLGALWALNRARSVEELRAAAMQWGGPVVNLVWAEVEKELGAYGWRVAGRVPLRRDLEKGLLPALSWEPAGQWAEGYIPANQLPEEISPERGYIVSANDRMAPFHYPYILSHEYMSSYRAEQIEQLILQAIAEVQAGGKQYSVESAAAIQTNQTSSTGLLLCKYITASVASSQEIAADPVRAQALDMLRKWDGNLSASSSAAAILKVTEDHLYRLVAQWLFAPPHADTWLGVAYTPLNPSLMYHWRIREILLQLLQSRPKDFQAIPAEMWDEFVRQAFRNALDELVRLQGKQPASWTWGNLHCLELTHSLVAVPAYQTLPPALRLIKKLFKLSRGPFAVGGDEHTPWQTSSHPVPAQAGTHPYRFRANAYQPAWRMIAWDNGRYYGCLPGGVSGHANAPWADNQLHDYLNGRYHERTLNNANG